MEEKNPISFPKNGQSYLVMGVINLTPDSFYANSRCSGLAEAITMATRMIDEGADILEIGAESSRPGAQPVSEKEELERLLPVITELNERFDLPLSVDTWKPKVAEMALEAGAGIINDITGLSRRPEMADVVAFYNAALVIMHMRGNPENMQDNPAYDDVVAEITEFLYKNISVAESAGVDPKAIAVDPGIGFGKTLEHNLKIINQLERFASINKSLLIGLSRKSFIGKITDLSADERLEGSLAATTISRVKGASIFRTHDIKETVRALKVVDAILETRKNNDSSLYQC
tara:strand:- start:1295 stop:2161 length:867 start_codon:yes stop_codon:yes gene_type:complete